MKVVVLFIATLLCSVISSAQKITISGYVKDEASKEALIGASVVNAIIKPELQLINMVFFL